MKENITQFQERVNEMSAKEVIKELIELKTIKWKSMLNKMYGENLPIKTTEEYQEEWENHERLWGEIMYLEGLSKEGK